MADSRGTELKRANLIALSLFLLAETIFGLVIYSSFNGEVTQRLSTREAELRAGVESIESSYRRVVEVIFQQALNKAEVIDTVAMANEVGISERKRLRGRLYRRFYPVYDLLKERNVVGLK